MSSPAFSQVSSEDKGNGVVTIGVDPHTASAMAPESSRVVGTVQIDASLRGYRRLLAWATASPSVAGR